MQSLWLFKAYLYIVPLPLARRSKPVK